MSSAEVCRERGWTAGTRLVGNQGYGPTVIEITAVGESCILAKTISHNGELRPGNSEGLWTLSCREWTAVPDLATGGIVRGDPVILREGDCITPRRLSSETTT